LTPQREEDKKLEKKLSELKKMKIKISLLLVILLLVFYSLLNADDIWVDPSGQADFTSIQDALDWVEANQVSFVHIHVSSDTYNKNIIIPSDIHIILEGDSTIISGDDTGQAVVTIESPHPEFQMLGFTIECNNLNRGIYITDYNVNPDYNMDFNENRESQWEPTHENDEIFHELLSNIEINNGYKEGNGAGIYFDNGYYFMIKNISISDCSAGVVGQNSYSGGGIYFSRCYNMKTEFLNIQNCIASQDGGGICFFDCYQYEGNSFIEGFNISNCQAGEYGGGICINESGLIGLAGTQYPYPAENSYINNCSAVCGSGIASYGEGQHPYNDLSLFDVEVNGNSAYNQGGGIYCNELKYDSWIRIHHSEIFSNNAYDGGGIHIENNDAKLYFIAGTEIYNNSAENYGGGIYSSNSYISNVFCCLSSCKIHDNVASEGGGIYSNNGCIRFDGTYRKIVEINRNTALDCGGGIFIRNNYSDSFIWNTIISNNSANAGAGIYCENANLEFSKLEICNNSATQFGGGLYLYESCPIIGNPIIIYENLARDGAGICCKGTISDLNNMVIVDNSANEYGGGIYFMDNSNVIMKNITIINNSANEGTGVYADGDINMTNSIVWDSVYESVNGTVTATYCDIKNGWPGEGNIDANPCLADITNLNYSLLQTSPCIDSGDPNSNIDPDGTIADMGPFTATLETYEFSSENINWVSFPVLTPNNVDAYDFFEPLIQNGSLRRVLYGDYKLYKDEDGVWQNDIGDIRTVDGYRVEMYEPDSISVYGYKVQPDTLISLYAEGNRAPEFYPMGYHNWIGYFLPYSQAPRDAFANVWDNLTFIKADSYTLRRKWNSDEWWGAVSGPVSVDYGKSYAVGVLENCNFAWNQSPFHIDKYNKPETGLFTYEDKMNYMPIFVDSTETLNGIDEIGVFFDDECIGASVVETFPVFIPAYIEEDSTRSKDCNELSFQIGTYDRKIRQTVEVSLYSIELDTFVDKPVILDKNSFAVVKLGIEEGIEFPEEFILYQNYPNPITNSTTISFIPSPGVEKSEIKIYNIKGQLIKKYDVQNAKSGINKLVWNGRNDNGKKLGNGIYFYKLISGDKSEIKKMLLLR